MASTKVEFYKGTFDDATLTKLEIYERYLQEWLPVPFSGRMGVSGAAIYDLFCGPGQDAEGNDGSPLRAVSAVRHHHENIAGKFVSLRLVFNDSHGPHVDDLKRRVGDRIVVEGDRELCEVEYHSRTFNDVFRDLKPRMEGAANLVFLDQFGATEVDPDFLRDLNRLGRTDVLFFLATNFFKRFAGRPEAPDFAIEKSEMVDVEYDHIHRAMTEQFREIVGGNFHFAPFSLKKESNIYGLVFASGDVLGLEKFLKVAWSVDAHAGEANFDIDGTRDQASLLQKPPVERFRSDLRKRLLDGELETDWAVFVHALKSGFIGEHARQVVRDLRRDGKIECRDSRGVNVMPRISNTARKEPRTIKLI